MHRFTFALRDAFVRIGQQWLTGLILLVATTLLITLINYPLAEVQFQLQGAKNGDELAAKINEVNFGLSNLFTLTALQTLVYAGAIVIWVRTILLGADEVLIDGFYVFLVRSLWLIWRQITAGVWYAVLIYLPGILFLILGFGWAFLAFYTFFIVLLVLPAYGAALAAAAVDFPLTVRKAWSTLGLYTLPLLGVGLVLLLIIVLPVTLIIIFLAYSTVSAMVDIGTVSVEKFTYIVAAQSLGQSTFIFLWTAICGVMLEHILEAKRAEREGRY